MNFKKIITSGSEQEQIKALQKIQEKANKLAMKQANKRKLYSFGR